MADKYILNEDKAYGLQVPAKAHRDIQRGEFVELVGMATDRFGIDTELYEVKDISATTVRGQLFYCNAEVKQYDERLTERDYFVAKDSAFRMRNVTQLGVITVHKDIVGEAVVLKDKLKLGVGKLAKSADGVGAIAVVDEVLTWKGQPSLKIRFL